MWNRSIKIVSICLLITITLGIVIHVYSQFWSFDTKRYDMYYIWMEGKRILSGENPYERILKGNMRENKKYPTYFPLFYLLAFLTQKAGLKDYPEWVSFWRFVFLFFNIGIASFIFYGLYQYKLTIISIFAALFWLFNRWTLHVAMMAQIDFMAIFFLLFSLLIFRKHKWTSLLFFSLSLAIKQIAIFLAPLYLIWVWQSSDKVTIKDIFIAASLIISIPMLISLPFIVWNAEAFFKSIIFSATRFPHAYSGTSSVDGILGLVGISAKLPMLFLMFLIYICAIRRKIGIYMSTMLTMFVFVYFNSVFFFQYICWAVPFIPLSLCDMFNDKRRSVLMNNV